VTTAAVPRMRKPTRGALLNVAHPLARGLVRCYLLNEGGGGIVRDLAQGAIADSHEEGVSPTWSAGRHGFQLQSTNSPRTVYEEPDSFEASSGNGSVSFAGIVDGSGNGEVFFAAYQCGLYSNTGGNIYARWTGISDQTLGTGAGGAVTGDPHLIVASYDKVAGTTKMWLDGILVDSNTGVTGDVNFNGQPLMLLARGSGSYQNLLTGHLHACWYWNRPLTDGEAWAFSMAPYDMIQRSPVGRTISIPGEVAAERAAVYTRKRRVLYPSILKPARGARVDLSNPLTRDMAACYVLNEQTGGVVRDLLRTIGEGALTGTTWGGGAVRFPNTANERIVMQAPKLVLSSAAGFTILCRAKRASTGSWRTIVGDGVNLSLYLYGTDGVVRYYDGAGSGVGAQGATPNPVGEWVTAGATSKDNSFAAVFRNGILDGYQATTTQGDFTLQCVGGNTGSEAFHGDIEFAYVWRRVLTDAEMLSISRDPYQILRPRAIYPALKVEPMAGVAPRTTHHTKPPRGAWLDRSHPLARGLKGAWLLNEQTGERVKDLASLSESVAFNNAPTRIPREGGGLDFDGVNQSVDLGEWNKVGRATRFTMVVLAEFDSLVSNDSIVRKWYSGDRSFYSAVGASSRIRFGIAEKGVRKVTETTSAISTGQLVQLGHVWHGGDDLRTFFDGEEQSLGTDIVAGSPAYIEPNVEHLMFGCRYNNGSEDAHMEGRIFYVFIWDRALSASEMKEVATRPFQFFRSPMTRKLLGTHSAPARTTSTFRRSITVKPPRGAALNRSHPLASKLVAGYLLNEGTGLKAHDLLGRHHGALENLDARPWVSTERGHAVAFNDSGRVKISGTPITDPPLSFFVVARGRDAWGFAVAIGHPTVGHWYTRHLDSTYRMRAGATVTSGGSNGAGGTTIIQPGELWTAAAVFHSTSFREIFVNGLKEGEDSTTYAPTSQNELRLGQSVRYDGNDFGGDIILVYVFAGALKPAEVASLNRDPYQLARSGVLVGSIPTPASFLTRRRG